MTIRNLGDDLKQRLGVQAAEHGHSMEEEARAILGRSMRRGSHWWAREGVLLLLTP